MSIGRPAGDTVGPFRLLHRIAVGGMAEVFLARRSDGRGPSVVIKRILPHLAEDDTFVAMFLQEARLAARIEHPNVVRMHQLGEEGGYPFLVMEYVPGCTLRQLIRHCESVDVAMPVGVAVDLVAQACDGAHAAHETVGPNGRLLDIVHRDLSPHNLIVSDDATVKVLDFGVAKASAEMNEKTLTGVLKGKLSYLSPEQCSHLPVDRRSDLFTLGIVLWESLAGVKLYDGQNELKTLQEIVGGIRPDLRTLRPDVPEVIHAVIDRALQVQPDARYPTAAALRDALLVGASQAGIAVERQHTRAFVAPLIQYVENTVAQARGIEITRPRPEDLEPDRSWLPIVAGLAVSGVAIAGLTLLVLLGVGGLLYSSSAVSTPSGPPIVVALAPTIDAALLPVELEPVRAYLERGLDRPVQLQVAASYAAAAEEIASGRAAFAMLPPFIYLETNATEPSVQALVTKVYDNSAGSDGVLLVRVDSDISALEHTMGKSICYPDQSSTTGYVLPRALLRRNGIDPDSDLTGFFSGNHLQVLRDLQSGRCQIGGTYTGAYMSAREADVQVSDVRVLAISGRTPHDALCSGPNTPPALKESIVELLLAFEPEVHAGTDLVGGVEKISGFEPVTEETYAALRQALADGEP